MLFGIERPAGKEVVILKCNPLSVIHILVSTAYLGVIAVK